MAYDIPIESTKMDAFGASVDRAIGKVEDLDRRVKDLNGTLNDTKTAGGRVVQAARNPADGADAGEAPSAKSAGYGRAVGPRDPVNPYKGGGSRQSLSREQRALEMAEEIGDDDLIRDQKAKVRRAQRRVAADDRLIDGKSSDMTEAAMSALMRSRVNLGPLSPLVMDLMPLLGKAGGMALSGVGAVVGLANSGAEAMRQGNRAYYEMGGSAGNVGAAMALGGENAAAKAIQLGDRLREGSFGSAYLRGQGIQDLGPAQVDKSSNYVQALDALRRMPDGPNKVRAYRELGLTEDEWTGDLSPRSFKRLMGSYGSAGSVGERRADAEFHASQDAAGNFLNRLHKAAARQPMKILGDVLGDIADPKAAFSRDAFNEIFSARGLLGETFGDWWDERHGGGKPEQNPYSMSFKGQRMGGAQKGWRDVEPGMGKGPSTINGNTSTVPAGWRGQAMERALSDQAMHLGAWSG